MERRCDHRKNTGSTPQGLGTANRTAVSQYLSGTGTLVQFLTMAMLACWGSNYRRATWRWEPATNRNTPVQTSQSSELKRTAVGISCRFRLHTCAILDDATVSPVGAIMSRWATRRWRHFGTSRSTPAQDIELWSRNRTAGSLRT